ncbi:MAG: SH3 domain-containing protein [Bacilli bacterium]
MNYLGANRYVSQDFVTHGKTAEDYSGDFLSDIYINGTAKVIRVVNSYKSHEDSINYGDFGNNRLAWRDGNYYNCISITGKTIRFPEDELGGNCIIVEGYVDNEYRSFGMYHMDSVFVNVGDIVNSTTLLGKQGNTGLVASGKSREDVTYGTHIHMEVKDSEGRFLNPREYATFLKQINYTSGSNEKNESVLQCEILVNSINIRESASASSNIIGKVYLNDLYTILETVEDSDYYWYKIKNKFEIVGYIANSKIDNWMKLYEPIPLVEEIPDKPLENKEILIFECIKDDTYYLKLYAGEKLYIKK